MVLFITICSFVTGAIVTVYKHAIGPCNLFQLCYLFHDKTRTEIPTVEPNTNDVRARSNVDEGSITVGNDSSNDTSIPALMGTIKTYSSVTNGLKKNTED